MGTGNYKDLIVWHRAMGFVPQVYAVARQLPKEETYALGDQLRRAAVSVPANIAEGQARQHRKEFLQYLAIAKGSLAELHTLLILTERLGFLSAEALTRLEQDLSGIARPLHRLISALSQKGVPPVANHEPTNHQLRTANPQKNLE